MRPEPDALEAAPWQAGQEPPPEMYDFPAGNRPSMWIRWRSRWVRCPVRARAYWRSSGRTVYHVDVHEWRDGCWGTFQHQFVWDSRTMRPAAYDSGRRVI